MRVRDIMATNPTTCGPDTGLRDIARQMVERDCGMIPIVSEEGKAVGTVTDRDIACRAVAKDRNPLQLSARDVMTTPCVTITVDADVAECARLLEKNQLRRIVVVDENDRCCGVVAQADIARQGSVDEAAEVVREVSQPSNQHARFRQ